MTFSILSVCTGNICRSPVAERMIADALASLTFVQVESAGTGALVGAGVPEQARRLAEHAQVNVADHVARQIDLSLIRGADLIVAMARDHRRYIVENLPAAMRRTFTLRELARLSEPLRPLLPRAVADAGATTPEEGMRAGIALAAAMRGTTPPPTDPDDFDVVDPFRRSDETYARSFGQLEPAARSVSEYLLSAAAAATN